MKSDAVRQTTGGDLGESLRNSEF